MGSFSIIFKKGRSIFRGRVFLNFKKGRGTFRSAAVLLLRIKKLKLKAVYMHGAVEVKLGQSGSPRAAEN